MFCNQIEETLFEPLPSSLWTDYYGDREADNHGVGIARNFLLQQQDLPSPNERILPSACHFRSPQRQFSYEDDCDENDNDDNFADECDEQGRRSYGNAAQQRRNNSRPNSPNGSYNSTTRTHASEVKSLFNHGCLFAYSNPEDLDRSGNSFRTRRRLSKKGPLSRRRYRIAPSPPQSPEGSTVEKFRDAEHLFRY